MLLVLRKETTKFFMPFCSSHFCWLLLEPFQRLFLLILHESYLVIEKIFFWSNWCISKSRRNYTRKISSSLMSGPLPCNQICSFCIKICNFWLCYIASDLSTNWYYCPTEYPNIRSQKQLIGFCWKTILHHTDPVLFKEV